ncbi:MAG: hypothetical protein PHS14_07650 [Elusimicrobia bacterium]|nr:hypothetical protein [Elusimicrobiota bacterium]
MKKTKQQRWKQRNPWARYVEFARRRCADADPQGPWYHYYYAKGVEVRLTAKDLAAIWHRDSAAKMKKPSLDRIDEDGHYEIGNVRFVEFAWNSRRAWDPLLKRSTPDLSAPNFA